MDLGHRHRAARNHSLRRHFARNEAKTTTPRAWIAEALESAQKRLLDVIPTNVPAALLV
jgi:hypothetical protein